MRHLFLFILFFAASVSATVRPLSSARADAFCKNPSLSKIHVFTIHSAATPAETLGVATLIDRRGLFLTAKHVITSLKVLSNESWISPLNSTDKFPINLNTVLSGGYGVSNKSDDWAIFEVEGDFDWVDHAFLKDLGKFEAIEVGTKVITAEGVRLVTSTSSEDDILDSKSCDSKSIYWIGLENYTYGQSGSPIASEGCVIGLTSGFKYPDSHNMREIQEELESLSNSSFDKLISELSARAPLNENERLMISRIRSNDDRSLAKDFRDLINLIDRAHIVRVTPSTCVFDGVYSAINRTTSNYSWDLLFEQRSRLSPPYDIDRIFNDSTSAYSFQNFIKKVMRSPQERSLIYLLELSPLAHSRCKTLGRVDPWPKRCRDLQDAVEYLAVNSGSPFLLKRPRSFYDFSSVEPALPPLVSFARSTGDDPEQGQLTPAYAPPRLAPHIRQPIGGLIGDAAELIGVPSRPSSLDSAHEMRGVTSVLMPSAGSRVAIPNDSRSAAAAKRREALDKIEMYVERLHEARLFYKQASAFIEDINHSTPDDRRIYSSYYDFKMRQLSAKLTPLYSFFSSHRSLNSKDLAFHIKLRRDLAIINQRAAEAQKRMQAIHDAFDKLQPVLETDPNSYN